MTVSEFVTVVGLAAGGLALAGIAVAGLMLALEQRKGGE